ncbi:MAG: hypothetical protein U9P71_07865 [Campylobacterota bacterium]|nr:hypothetical protein [Campylobacterota bacterium]
MKQLLGSLLVWLFFSLTLHASYMWNATASKSEIYTNEAVELLLECQFLDDGYGYSIELESMQDPDYEMHLLSQIENETGGKRNVIYRFILFAKTPGILPLNFTAQMRKTTRESIENSIIGRDNVEDLAFITETISLPTLNLHVKKALSLLVGDFDFNVEVDATTLEAYKPLNITLTINGSGNFQNLEPFTIEFQNAEVFAEKPVKEFVLTSQGYQGRYRQQFAVVAHSDFTIKPFELSFHNLKSRDVETLHSKTYNINITPAFSKEELLNEVPVVDKAHSSTVSIYMYIAFFILGLFVGRYFYVVVSSGKGSFLSMVLKRIALLFRKVDDFIWRIQSDEKDLKKSELQHSIRLCKSEKDLLVLLIVADASKFYDVISVLELKKVPLKKAKHQAIELV